MFFGILKLSIAPQASKRLYLPPGVGGGVAGRAAQDLRALPRVASGRRAHHAEVRSRVQ